MKKKTFIRIDDNSWLKKNKLCILCGKTTAFTLVELIIVVAILGILLSIVLPEFQDHSQKANEKAGILTENL